MSATEATIRDYLADHLDVLESGLTLIQKEYPLRNPTGSKGYIDILARDVLGNRVIDSEGRVLRAARHVPVQLIDPLELFRHHHVYLFETASGSDEAEEKVVEAFRTAGGLSAYLLRLSYIGGESRVIYPHALYLVPGSVSPEARQKLERDLTEELPEFDPRSEEGRMSIEEWFGVDMVSAVGSDTFEIGYPEKLDSMLKLGWETNRVTRIGDVPNAAAADDIEVVRSIVGTEGKNAQQFLRVTSPRLHLDWINANDSFEYCLRGNEAWSLAVGCFCERVASELPEGTVSFAIYNPLALPLSLFKLVARGDTRYLPELELFAWDEHTRQASFLLGGIVWNGRNRCSARWVRPASIASMS